MKQVENATINTEQYFKNLDIETIYEVNEGNHFTDAIERIVKGISWLVGSSGERLL